MSKITESARGQMCQIRLPHICSHDPETTVFCHLPDGSGGIMGGKSTSLHGVYGCADCHSEIDGRSHRFVKQMQEEDGMDPIWAKILLRLYAYEGQQRTLDILLAKRLIQL